MIMNDLFEYICEMDDISLRNLITRSEDIISSFVEEFDYDCDEVRRFYYSSIIPQVKRNIIDDKIKDLEEDFKV